MNEKLINEIKGEIGICKKEIINANNEILKATEKHKHYEDRKIMLEHLREMAEIEQANCPTNNKLKGAENE